MRIPLGNNLQSRDGLLDKECKAVNVLLEPNGDPQSPGLTIRSRPGVTDQGLIRAGTAQLLTPWAGISGIVGDYFFTVGTCGGAITSGSNGDLTALSPDSVAIPENGRGLAIHPNGNFAYCSNVNSGTNANPEISMYSINASGQLALLSPASIAMSASAAPAIVLISPDGLFAYCSDVNNNEIKQFSVNTSTGQLTALGTPSYSPASGGIYSASCLSPDGLFFYIDGAIGANKVIYQCARNAGTGLISALGTPSITTGAAGGFGALVISADGTSVYGCSYSDDKIYQFSRNTSTGLLTALGSPTVNTGSYPFGMCISPDGLNVYTSNNVSDTLSQFSRNTSTGALTALSPATIAVDATKGDPGYLMITTNGLNLYVSYRAGFNSIGQFSRSASTGLLSAMTTPFVATGQAPSAIAQNGSYVYAASENKLIYQYGIVSDAPTLTSLSPSTSGEQFTAQDNGANAFEGYLMFKNSTQAWYLSNQSGSVPTLISDVDFPGTYTVPLTGLTRSGTVATATAAVDTNFQVGSSVTIAGATPSAYNGAKTITSISPSTTTDIGPVPITITRSSTTATATATEPHGFSNGMSILIAGASQPEYNGLKTITLIDANKFSFTVTVTGPAAPATPATGSPVITDQGQFMNGGNASGTPTVLEFVYAVGQETFTTGDSVTYTGQYNSSYNGTYTATVPYAGLLQITVGGLTYPAIAQGYVKHATAPTVSSITNANNVATVTTSAPHKYLSGKTVTITGATQSQYNITARITVTSSTTFTYSLGPIVESPATPATGTITASYNSVQGYSFTFTQTGAPSSPATGTITASGGRATVPGIAYLNGYFTVMDRYGVIYTSDPDDPRSWKALDYTVAQNETGDGVYLGKSQNYIVAFKANSTEFFYDAANPIGSPLSPVENGFTQVGCASAGSVAKLGEDYLWISKSKNIRGRAVHMMVGTQQKKVSTADIDRILNLDDLSSVFSYGLKLDGHSLYVLTLVESNVTLVYDLEANAWSQWTSLTIGSSKSVSSITLSGTTATVTCGVAHTLNDGDPVTISGANQAGYNGTWQISYVSSTVFTIQVAAGLTTPATGTILAYPYTESYFKFTHYSSCSDADLMLHKTTGHLYELFSNVHRDGDYPIAVFLRSQRLDGGALGYKNIPRIFFIGDKLDDRIMVRWSDDDSTTFSAYRNMDLNQQRPMCRRSRAFRRRTYEHKFIGNNLLVGSETELELKT